MKHPLYISLILLAHLSFGQVTHESIVNEIYLTKVDTSFPTYKLLDKSVRLSDVLKGNETEIRKDLTALLPEDIVEGFISKAYNDTTSYSWQFSRLINAVSISTEDILKENSLEPFVVNPKWSDAKRRKESEKHFESERVKREERPLFEKKHFSYSIPLLDDNGSYLLIFLDEGSGESGHGCIYIFESINSEWQLIGTTRCRIS